MRAFFRKVDDIREFGIKNLGLEDDGNYGKYLELDRDFLVAVVNAAPHDSLEPYLWRYPLFGPAPYRGFYNEDHARAEADRLDRDGYEVWVRRVDGFSTLGITRDPLISFMQEYSLFRLAELIFHEQIHASFWVPRQIQFNEELATVLGRQAALEYLAHSFGEGTPELLAAKNSARDSRLFFRDMNSLAGELDSLYTSVPGDGLTREEILSQRDAVIAEFQADFAEQYAQRYLGQGFTRFSEMEINNAFLSLYRTYSERGESYERLYERAGSVRQFLALLQSAMDDPESFAIDYERGDDPYALIRGLLDWHHQRSAS